MFNKIFVRKAILSVALLFACFASNANLISVESSVSEINNETSFKVEFWAKDLNNEVISAYDLAISFSQDIFEFQQLVFGSALGGGIDSIQEQTPGNGKVLFSELSFLFDSELLALQSGIEFLLATIEFKAIGLGFGSVSIESGNFVGSNFSPLTLDTSSSVQIEVLAQNVSEPYIVSILILATLLLVMRARFFDVKYEELRA